MDQEKTAADHASSENVHSEYAAVQSGTDLNDGQTVVAHDVVNDENVVSSEAKPVSEAATVGATDEVNPDVAAGPSQNLSGHDDAAGLAASQEIAYDPLSGNGGEAVNYQSTVAIENGGMSHQMGGHVFEQAYTDVVYSAEEERLWNIVRTNCLDFNAWSALIEETEKVAENDIIKIRKVYDAFLAEFPLCYGYWKKYADHEGRLDSIEKVVEVYERAVLAVTYSVEIWLHYCVFAISTYDDPDIIRRLFERGLAYVGTDYQSHQLWDEYISYEESRQAWSHLAMIYTRILENPIQQLDRYFNCFKELTASHPLSEIRTAEEAAMVASTMETGSHTLEGEAPPNVDELSTNPVSAGLPEAEELEKYVAIREEMYKKAKEFDSKMIGFETAIRRPYFHVRPLDDHELENWHNYIDFMERGDDFNKVVKLYERCLIACANYPEFWIRYVLCMEASGSMELASNALARATQVFVKKRSEIHLFAAKFKELSGDVLGARMEYQILYSEVSPGFLEAIIKHANMEYRLDDKDAAFSIYEAAIAAEQAKEHSSILPFLLVQFSRFLYLVAGNAEKAREVLTGNLEQLQLSRSLLEAVIHLESIQPLPKRIDYLDSLVEKFVTPNPDNPNTVSMVDKEEISAIFLEFLDLFGHAQAIKKAENRHAALFLRQRNVLISKKRQAEDSLGSDKVKMAKSFSEQGQPVMGAYPNAQNQWPSGYGQKAPAWPPTSQPQAQWNPAYGQQAGYAAYGSYGSYGNPQVATPAPQGAAAYGAYPQTYAAQAYPQQSFAQPTLATAAAVSATPAVPPQPVTAAQPYYGSYYQ